ncbi:MAG: site-specific integrase [Acidobacteriota bacterium]|nr:site-specific integrase [Acidobacteriota bacterium]
MPRERSGSVVKRNRDRKGNRAVSWWARLTYIDPVTNKRRDLQRKAEGRAHARELVQQLLTECDAADGRTLVHDRKKFADLAAYFKAHFLKEAQYVDGRKVSGRRSLRGTAGQLEAMLAFFGSRPLRSISYADLAAFKAERLQAPTRADLARHRAALEEDSGAELRPTRTIATVNRELALLQRMFNVAQEEGWVLRNPFKLGKSLISQADERKRERIITREEERRLLEACAGRRAHLRPIVLCALDTGMRQGEILKLRWRDVDLENGVIAIAAFNTKTMRERTVQTTIRLRLELEALHGRSAKDPDALVFGVGDNVKHGFAGARRAAGLDDVRFHDLRHTAATRLRRSHMHISEVGRVLGHTQANTTYRYVNADAETARRAAEALDAFHAEADRGHKAKDEPENVN